MRPIVSRAFVGLGLLSGFIAVMVIGFHVWRSPGGFAGALSWTGSGRMEAVQARLALAQKPEDRWTELGPAALLTAQHGDPVQAEAYAKELLLLVPQNERNWNYGNAIHEANLALGFVALRRGDAAAAKAFLLEAGKTPGSPQLDSFGPNMSLAKALIERGEREVVLQYFAQCQVFWKNHDGDLAKWAALVKVGIVPDFGAHLHY